MNNGLTTDNEPTKMQWAQIVQTTFINGGMGDMTFETGLSIATLNLNS